MAGNYGNPYERIQLAPRIQNKRSGVAEILTRGFSNMASTAERGINAYEKAKQDEANAEALRAVDENYGRNNAATDVDGVTVKNGVLAIDPATAKLLEDGKVIQDKVNALDKQNIDIQLKAIDQAADMNPAAKSRARRKVKESTKLAPSSAEFLSDKEKNRLEFSRIIQDRIAKAATNFDSNTEKVRQEALAGADAGTQEKITSLIRENERNNLLDKRYKADKKAIKLQQDIDNAYKDLQLSMQQADQKARVEAAKNLQSLRNKQEARAKISQEQATILFNQAQSDRNDSINIANTVYTVEPTITVTHGKQPLTKEEKAKLSAKAAYDNMTEQEQINFANEFRAADKEVTAIKNKIAKLKTAANPKKAIKDTQEVRLKQLEKDFNEKPIAELESRLSKSEQDFAKRRASKLNITYDQSIKDALEKKIHGTSIGRFVEDLLPSKGSTSDERNANAKIVKLQQSLKFKESLRDGIETRYTKKANTRLGNTLGEIAVQTKDAPYAEPKQEFVQPDEYEQALFQDAAQGNIKNKSVIYSDPRFKNKVKTYRERYATYTAAKVSLAAANLKYAQDLAKFNLKVRSEKELAKFKSELDANIARQKNKYKESQIKLEASLD